MLLTEREDSLITLLRSSVCKKVEKSYDTGLLIISCCCCVCVLCVPAVHYYCFAKSAAAAIVHRKRSVQDLVRRACAYGIVVPVSDGTRESATEKSRTYQPVRIPRIAGLTVDAVACKARLVYC